MSDTRRHPPLVDRSNPHLIVPDSQSRALDRRQSLDDQQRAFQRRSGSAPHQFRDRKPA